VPRNAVVSVGYLWGRSGTRTFGIFVGARQRSPAAHRAVASSHVGRDAVVGAADQRGAAGAGAVAGELCRVRPFSSFRSASAPPRLSQGEQRRSRCGVRL
jgi:hypothetical protein